MSLVIPDSIKPFHNAFVGFTNHSYKYDAQSVFIDLLDLIIGIHSQDEASLLSLENRYNLKEQKQLFDLYSILLKNYASNLGEGFVWFDLLGTYYEILASQSKKSMFRQFFTPPNIANCMSEIILSPTKDIIKINDPCCGSGRMLLSAHCKLKGGCIAYAEDLDPICSKMTVVNFFLHGVVGEVIHHDSLNPSSFIGGWHVNSNLHKLGTPSIIKLASEKDSYIIQSWKQKLLNKSENDKKAILKEQQILVKNNQLSLF